MEIPLERNGGVARNNRLRAIAALPPSALRFDHRFTPNPAR
jgi:hypothetical protein